jgi:peptide/nickel transport system substrate-binding protein
MNVVYNTKKPPFDNDKVRRAFNFAFNRASYLDSQRGDAVAGGVMPPPPYSPFGLPPEELAKLPGWGRPERDKAEARRLLREAGFGPEHPLTVPITARGIPLYQDLAVWMAGELKEVGVIATLDVAESTQFFARMARRDFLVAANVTGTGSGDPDAILFENYLCGSPRNYSDYCNPEVQKLIEEQSQELDTARRVVLVRNIDRRLQTDAARTILGQIVDYAMYWPYVKGYVPHNSIFNYGRMQDVWLDK